MVFDIKALQDHYFYLLPTLMYTQTMSYTPVSLRLPEVEEAYRARRKSLPVDAGCPLCSDEPAIHTFTHWRIVINAFPYGKIAEVHHMLIPIRHIDERGLTQEEKEELIEIKHTYIADTYQYVIKATKKFKSIPDHFHVHLINPRAVLIP